MQPKLQCNSYHLDLQTLKFVGVKIGEEKKSGWLLELAGHTYIFEIMSHHNPGENLFEEKLLGSGAGFNHGSYSVFNVLL